MEDDQVRLDLKPKELMACQFYMYKTKKFAKQIKDVPVLVVHGKMDGESKEVGSLGVFKRLKTDKKKYVLLENGDHYSFEDVKVSDEAFNNALSWIDSNVPSGDGK
jgi:alpha-beta hydrolase superfamily lysophospholipase